MEAAIYCRVSTEDQEREGTSLQSQLEACKKLAQEQGYEAPEEFIAEETYSGLSLDRPKLNEVRQWVRDKEVDAVIAYTLDRLSPDPVHFIILQEELERAGVELILVTEDIDSSDMGRLITHIKGFAAKLEAEKIRERTMRGLRMRAQSGKLPSGRGGRLYGYHYIKGKGEGQGIRVPNEDEAEIVREIYRCLVDEGLSLYAITQRLRSLGIPTPSRQNVWNKSTIHTILSNPAYYGKTYVFTHASTESKAPRKLNRRNRKTHKELRPREEWIEVPNATPPIIGEDMFKAAQERLRRNRELSRRNTKRAYLLRGFIKCRWCGRNYIGHTTRSIKGGQPYWRGYYHCSAYNSLNHPTPCGNQWYRVQYLDQVVWEHIEALLGNPELVMAEIEKRRESAEDASLLERNLDKVEVQLAN